MRVNCTAQCSCFFLFYFPLYCMRLSHMIKIFDLTYCSITWEDCACSCSLFTVDIKRYWLLYGSRLVSVSLVTRDLPPAFHRWCWTWSSRCSFLRVSRYGEWSHCWTTREPAQLCTKSHQLIDETICYLLQPTSTEDFNYYTRLLTRLEANSNISWTTVRLSSLLVSTIDHTISQCQVFTD